MDLRTKVGGRRTAALIGGGVIAFAFSGGGPAAEPQKPPPGQGTICALGIYSLMSQVGSVCHPGEAPELQTELQNAVDRLGDYIIKNGGVSRADLDRFKREQGGQGVPKEKLCREDALLMYGAVRKEGPGAVRKQIDEAVARPGTPTLGDCL